MKICVIGAFGFEMLDKTTGGQPVKTRQLYYTLADHYGKENISYIETYGWKSHPLKMIFSVFREAKKCEALIMLPAHHGVQVFSRLLVYCKKKFGVRIFYDVIGGWLPEITVEDNTLSSKLMKFDGIWVETSSMKNSLVKQGFSNVTVIPNFKKLVCIKPEQFPKEYAEPYKVCTFSRVMKEKGIEDAIKAVIEINNRIGKNIFVLDIYGPVDKSYSNCFENAKMYFPNYINYCGICEPERSVDVLKNYSALLFPTYYDGEGFAGTLIDALFAGVPVIASDWKYNSEIIHDKYTGLIHRVNDIDDIIDKLMYIYREQDKWNRMRLNCIESAQIYSYENVGKQICDALKIPI